MLYVQAGDLPGSDLNKGVLVTAAISWAWIRQAATASITALMVALVAACSADFPSRSDAGDGSTVDVLSTPDTALEEGGVDLVKVPVEDASEAGNVVKQTSALGLGILSSLHGKTVVTSPASTVVALSMLASGAEGETEDEFAVILGASGEARNQAVNALVAALDPYRVAPADIDLDSLPDHPQIHMASQVVADDDLNINPVYVHSLEKWFDAGILETDLQAPGAKKILNDWVRENTAGLIKESGLDITEDTVLALQNAIVLAAAWTHPFEPYATAPEQFHRLDGTDVEVDFMNGTFHVPYSETGEWKMVELPYGDDGSLVARYVIGPEEVAVSSLDAPVLDTLEMSLSEQTVFVSIPKLDLTSTASLVDPLQRQGLTSVFSGAPNALSYISDARDLIVDQVVQQGRFKVDEAGTVAAAITEVGIDTASAVSPEQEFVADRPQIIIIKDKTTGWDLFQVLVNDPTGA